MTPDDRIHEAIPNANETHIIWEGPFEVETLLRHPECRRPDPLATKRHDHRYRKPGVYLWTEPCQIGGTPDQVVSYVGKAEKDLWERQWVHYFYQIGGQAVIPESWREDKNAWGVNYDCPEMHEVVFTYDKFITVVADAFKYIKDSRIYLSPYCENTGVLERNLLWDLQPKRTTRNTKSQPGTRLTIIHHNAVWATTSALSDCNRECNKQWRPRVCTDSDCKKCLQGLHAAQRFVNR